MSIFLRRYSLRLHFRTLTLYRHDILKPTTEISINENVVCDLPYLGLISIEGEDATEFLQGQFSNDIKLLDNNNSQINSYNSPKGRMFASFRLFKKDDCYFMLLPKELIEPIIKRLRMFVMRSKVVLDDLSDSWSCIGLSGPDASSIDMFPEAVNATAHNDVLSIIHIPGIASRLLIVGPTENVENFKNNLSDQFTAAESSHWKRLDIHAGIPNIYSSTQESFVPQMVNLQLVDGVSFTKGCYPGQEVVARMHYLGKLKKRMYRIIVDSNETPAPGDNLYLSGSENTQSIGQIVDAQLNDQGSVDALAVIQTSAIDKDIRVGDNNGPAVSFAELPYAAE